MKTTKRLLVLALVGVLALVSFIPATFSWYSHNKSATGSSIHYEDKLDVSVKSSDSSVTLSTVVCDAGGTVSSTEEVNSVSVSPRAIDSQGSVVYYKSTLTNSGTNDVMVDLETGDLPNNADFSIGTVSPTLNEKAYASRPVRTKVSDTTVRVYFKPNTDMASYWSKDNGVLNPESGTYDVSTGNVIGSGWEAGASAHAAENTGTSNDINLSYTVDGKEFQVKMNKCMKNNSDSVDTNWSKTGTKVYYYDIPANAEHFFFFNHWYLRSNSNREWNCTIDITDLSPGKLYYLSGASIDGKWKEYKVQPVDATLAAVNTYYQSVRMSLGDSVFADISLKKESETDDEEFVPDYYGAQITYSISGTDLAKASVNTDGLITPKATTTSGSTDTPITVRTTVTGRFGDSIVKETKVSIPAEINQVPIMKNIKVPAGESVDVFWYARNNSTRDTMTTSSIYITL